MPKGWGTVQTEAWARLRSACSSGQCEPTTSEKPVPNANRRRPALRGEVTIALADADGSTDVLVVHKGLRCGLPSADNVDGWRSSFAKLAALIEAG